MRSRKTSFLDVLVSRTDEGNLSTSIYRKPTHTNQLLDFNSHHPVSVKRSVVSTLTNTLPLTIMAKKQEIQHLRKVFTANNYSQQFVHQTMHRSLTTHNTPRCETPQAIVSIPYIKGISEHIRRVLAECNIRTFFKTTNTLRQLLSHPKDCIPLKNKSGVVYYIPCKDCTFIYIGETGQHLATRL